VSGYIRPEIVQELLEGLADALERASPDERFPAYMHSKFIRVAIRNYDQVSKEQQPNGSTNVVPADRQTLRTPLPGERAAASESVSSSSYISPGTDSSRSFPPDGPSSSSASLFSSGAAAANPYAPGGPLSPTGQTAQVAFCSPVPMPAALTLGRELGLDWQTFASGTTTSGAGGAVDNGAGKGIPQQQHQQQQPQAPATAPASVTLAPRPASAAAAIRARPPPPRSPMLPPPSGSGGGSVSIEDAASAAASAGRSKTSDGQSGGGGGGKPRELAWEWEAYSRRIASDTGNFWQGFR
jgi:pyruvate/2-oxoglutarate dehydrogenase complex dihydrolipoamide acyltransferase (E2) component